MGYNNLIVTQTGQRVKKRFGKNSDFLPDFLEKTKVILALDSSEQIKPDTPIEADKIEVPAWTVWVLDLRRPEK